MTMDNEGAALKFEASMFSLLNKLDKSTLRVVLARSFNKTAEKARQVALGALRGINIDVQGDRTDWESSLRTHIYSRGGGFLISVQGRTRFMQGGEKSMHKNRYFGRTKRKLPVLQWIEQGVESRMTRGNKRKKHATGSFAGKHFLRKSEQKMAQVVEQETLKDMNEILGDIAKNT